MRGNTKLLSAALAAKAAFGQQTLEAAVLTLPRACRGSAGAGVRQAVKDSTQSLLRSFAADAAPMSPLASAASSRTAQAASSSGRISLAELTQLYKQLSKFRLSALVVSTAAAGYIAGPPRRAAAPLSAACLHACQAWPMRPYPMQPRPQRPSAISTILAEPAIP